MTKTKTKPEPYTITLGPRYQWNRSYYVLYHTFNGVQWSLSLYDKNSKKEAREAALEELAKRKARASARLREVLTNPRPEKAQVGNPYTVIRIDGYHQLKDGWGKFMIHYSTPTGYKNYFVTGYCQDELAAFQYGLRYLKALSNGAKRNAERRARRRQELINKYVTPNMLGTGDG